MKAAWHVLQVGSGSPGHTRQDITTLVGTNQGLVAFTHLWFYSSGPPEVLTAPTPRNFIEAGGESWKWQVSSFPVMGLTSCPVRRRPR